MRKLNQSGFSTVEAILILVIVAIIGFTGWFVWHSKNNTDKSLTDTSNSQTPIAQKKTTPTKATQTPATTTKYLVIKEWGVRASYSNTDTLSYAFRNEGVDTATVISKNLAGNYSCTEFGAGAIIRATPDTIIDPGPQTVEEVSKTDPTDYIRIGNYYYYFGHDQAACSEKVASDSAGETAQGAANDLTKSLVPKLEAIPQ